MDVKHYQTTDNGEIEIVNGLITMNGGLESAVYISLFGGNKDDDGTSSKELKQWWGNFGETVTCRSQTQYLLNSIPAIPINMLKIKEAAENDTKWLLDNKIATSINVEVDIIGLNMVKLTIIILADGEKIELQYIENWRAQ